MEDRLGAVGFRLIFLNRFPESFAAAREERIKVSDNRHQYDDLSRFVAEQTLMKRLITDNHNPAAVEKNRRLDGANRRALS